MTPSPNSAGSLRVACDEIDAIDLLAKVRVTTLVMPGRRDNAAPLEKAVA